MTGLTALVALLFSSWALIVRPGFALGLVVLSMLIYPEYMRIQIGPAAMSVPRIVVVLLLLKLSLTGAFKRTPFDKTDFIVIALWAWTILAATISGQAVSQLIGRGFDTMLMYFVARYTIRDSKDLSAFFFPVFLVLTVVGLLGVMEAVTTYTPYKMFVRFLGETVHLLKGDEFRLGLLRARGSTAVHIYFGMAMVVVVGLAWSVRGYVRSKMLFGLGMIIGIAGALSSMSSGPWIGVIMLFFLCSYSKKVSLIKPSLWLLLLFAVCLELASNRHFYHLVGYLALNSSTAWYRVKLLEVAYENLSDFWLFGAPAEDILHWANYIDERPKVDIVNHFLLIGLYSGLLGMVLYITSHVLAIRRVMAAWRASENKEYRNLLFGLGAALLAIDVSSFSTSLFGPVLLLSHILLGMMVSVSYFEGNGKTKLVSQRLRMGETGPDSIKRF